MVESFKVDNKWVMESVQRILIEVHVDFGNKWEPMYSILHLFRARTKQLCFLFVGHDLVYKTVEF